MMMRRSLLAAIGLFAFAHVASAQQATAIGPNPACSAFGTTAGTCAQGSDTRFTVATFQTLTSGSSATFTTPPGARQLKITMAGGGGGGAGSGTSTPGDATAGGDTIFNGIHAAGGSPGGIASNSVPGLGGTAGTGTATLRSPGASGTSGTFSGASGTTFGAGGTGGASCLGAGGKSGSLTSAGSASAPNSGGGGGGAGTGNVTSSAGGGGGGSGECVLLVIPGPAASYLYTIGPAGGAGSAGASGLAGAAAGTGEAFVEVDY